ncbi:BCCT family transporter [Kocuria sp. U4B]
MTRSTDTKQRLLASMRAQRIRQRLRRPQGLDKTVFAASGLIALAFVAWGFASPSSLGAVAAGALEWVMTSTGWLFVVAATVFTVYIIWIALSRFGRIPLGRDGERPQFRTTSWVAMMFATGMGIGLMFYGVGEPLFFYMSPPPGTVEGRTPEAMQTAMGTTLFHWTLYPWAMYALVGLAMAYGTYRLGRSQLFSSMFTSLFGPRVVNGIGGKVINVLAILATLFGSAASLGLGALQIGGGLESTGLVGTAGRWTLVLVIAVLTACFVASAISGVERGIQALSNINMVLAVVLAVVVFVGGPTLFILDVIPSAVGNFVGELPVMASRTAASGDESVAAWMSSWTVFYWAWWISWTPFVGLFIARISRGRTIREFVGGVLLVPSVVSLIWFSVFGGGAIGLQERAEAAGDEAGMLTRMVDGAPDLDFDLALFGLLGALPVPALVGGALVVLAIVLVAIFFVTGADSASIVMGSLSENGAEEPSKKSVVFWGVLTGGVAAAMLLAGGEDGAEALTGLKNITIVSALPFVVVMLVLCVALYKDLAADPLVLRGELAASLLEDSVEAAVERHEGEDFALVTTPAAVDPGEAPGEAPDAGPGLRAGSSSPA